MSVFLSTELGIDNHKLESLGAFDSVIDEDSNYFINLKRLCEAQVPEFSESYAKINAYFHNIGLLLLTSEEVNDKCYKAALKLFDFSEVNGINLGFSESKRGAGFGKGLRKQIIFDAYQIIKRGSQYPELFHLISLFEENVGPDRLSDMIATIIKDDIISYTTRINKELGITSANYPQYKFNGNLMCNPYKDCDILLLPIEILHELPIAKCWDDIDRVVRENEAIKDEINELVCDEWSKMTSRAKKEYLKNYIFMNPDKCYRVIKAYRNVSIDKFDIYKNTEYLIRKIVDNIGCKISESDEKDSYTSAIEILQLFKDWTENNKGFSVIQSANTKDREKIVQRTIHSCALYYAKKNCLDISPESNTGRGPVDFKISRGTDKTVIELKLSSNNQCVHGFNVQIEEYAKSEQTNSKIFLLVDLGDNRKNIDAVYKSNEERLANGETPSTIFMVDARKKDSASRI